jgi:hypothetical protein
VSQIEESPQTKSWLMPILGQLKFGISCRILFFKIFALSQRGALNNELRSYRTWASNVAKEKQQNYRVHAIALS